jgi:hypothetical protein
MAQISVGMFSCLSSLFALESCIKNLSDVNDLRRSHLRRITSFAKVHRECTKNWLRRAGVGCGVTPKRFAGNIEPGSSAVPVGHAGLSNFSRPSPTCCRHIAL